MLYSAQIRAARALLGWTQAELAARAGVGLATLQRVEQSEGVARGIFSTVMKVQRTLEDAGIRFIDSDEVEGIGVRLTKPEPDRGST
jgi:transcriptional regulator with XRE-family HTH domain